MRAFLVVCVLLSSLLSPGLFTATALDLPVWMPGGQVDQVTDLPFQGVFGTVNLSDANDARDLVVNRDYGNFGGFLIKQSGSLTFLDCPGSLPYSTTAQSVNKQVDVVGSCAYGDRSRGYLYTHSNPSNPYRLITLAGARDVLAYGVNDHKHVVGSYLPEGSTWERGFWWSNGGHQNIDAPWPGRKATLVHAVTNSGKMAGVWVDGNDNYRGFTRASGVSTMVDVPGARWTFLLDMNEQGQLIGWYRGWDDTVGPFLYDKGTWYTVTVTQQNVLFTEINGLNNRTQLVGRLGIAQPGSLVEVVSRGLVLLPSPELAHEAAAVPSMALRSMAFAPTASAPTVLIPDWPHDYQPRKGKPLPWER